ncbi:MAG: hypothetical protein PHS53_03325 [Candidatus Pacebacteria bacterium]|nr:hypothetical protein [Candidatus Paceibacterota bacterium]MDD5357147.1 hypothetical protein [Candidatus Paceibacterota bacterium]
MGPKDEGQDTMVRIIEGDEDMGLLETLTGHELCQTAEQILTARLKVFDTRKVKLVSVHEPHESSIKGSVYQDRLNQECPRARLGLEDMKLIGDYPERRDEVLARLVKEDEEHLANNPGIPLGDSAFLSLYKNQDKIPEEWKERDGEGKTRRITFDGSDLATREDKHIKVFFFWAGGKWRVGSYSDDDDLTTNYVSAVYQDH